MSPPSYIAYYNGKFLNESDIAISPNDRGFLYGDGVFDTMRSVNRSVISYRAHYDRLEESCRRTGIKLTLDPPALRHVLADLFVKNEVSDAYIRVSISRGTGDQFGFGYSTTMKPTILVAVRPIKNIPDHLYESGVAIDFEYTPMFNSLEKQSKLKSLSAQTYVLAKQKALKKNCYEMIFMDSLGNVYEGSSSNLFIIINGTVSTPPTASGILPGTTRARVIRICDEKMKIKVSEKPISQNEMFQADEIFLTNTNIQVLPVTQAGKKLISNGSIGPITKQILNTFRQTLIEILE